MAERISDERRALRVANELSRRTNVDSVPQVRFDPGIINLRTLEQDLKRERNIIPSPLKENLNYNHEIRETILNWILTVCHCNQISIDTYALTIRLFDMFMEKYSQELPQTLFQLLAGTALLISSKLLDASTISMKTIIEFVGKGYTSSDFTEMETMLLASLRESPSVKQLYGVTPVDIIPIIARFSNEVRYFEVIRCKANLLYGLLAHTRVLFGVLPSLVAGALIYRASLHLTEDASKLQERILLLIKAKKDNFEYILDKIERALIEWMKKSDDKTIMLPTFNLQAMPSESTPTDILTSSKIMGFLF